MKKWLRERGTILFLSHTAIIRHQGEKMGVSIAICELEAKNALCKDYKTNIVKAMVDDISGIEDIVEVDEYVTLEDAGKLFPDWESFMKRNRLNAETDAVYIVKVKNDDDLAKLKPYVKKKYTGWVSLEGLDEAKKDEVLKRSKKENRITGWDLLEFDEMNEMCAKCSLSWDKGRGCMGAFGPDSSKLPEIAKKHGCAIIASALENAREQKRFSSEDAKTLKDEVAKITAVLPDEGKVYVNRYGGVLERLGAVADVCIKEGCGFLFF